MRAPRVCGAAGKKKIPEIQGTGGNPGKTGSGTHLLPWGCHTIMELVLAALPVETTGALLRTGATAERAAILTVEMCSCGNECQVRAIESDKLNSSENTIRARGRK